LICPQLEHILLLGKKRLAMTTTQLRNFALYSIICRNIPNPTSAIALLNVKQVYNPKSYVKLANQCISLTRKQINLF